MSVNGDSTANPNPENIKQWVYAVQNPSEVKSLTFDFNGLSSGFTAAAEKSFNSVVYNPSVKFMLPKKSQLEDPSGIYCKATTGATESGTRYWCYEKYAETTDNSTAEPKKELVCVAENVGNNFIPAGTKLVNGTITLSCKEKCITQSGLGTACTTVGFTDPGGVVNPELGGGVVNPELGGGAVLAP